MAPATDSPAAPLAATLSDAELLHTRAYVAGSFVDADDGSTCSVIDPATGNSVATVPNMGSSETRRAIEAAATIQHAWQRELAETRSNVLQKFARLMLEHQEDLALILTTEQGKPLVESRGEIAYAAGFLHWFGQEAPRAYGDTIPTHRLGSRVLTLRQPVGVCAGITPWNFPSAMITRKLGPALATGCAMVLKPAEATPLSALALAELSRRAGVPPGLFSVVTGDRSAAAVIGDELTSNPQVRKLSFTGSTRVGKLLAAQCANTVKRVSLELGGNAPFIVFDDADLDAAVAGAMICKFRNCGQTCVSANRFLVQAGVFDEFSGRFAEAIARLKVGGGTDPETTIGPLINQAAADKVKRHLQDAVERGGKILLGGNPHSLGGTYFEPTLLSEVHQDMLMCQEETFGPVAGLQRFDAEAEAIALANDTPYGLAAYFYSRDVGRCWRVSEALEYGMVGVNTGLVSTPIAPFGGVKESGLGREGSRYGIDDYLETKYVCMADT